MIIKNLILVIICFIAYAQTFSNMVILDDYAGIMGAINIEPNSFFTLILGVFDGNIGSLHGYSLFMHCFVVSAFFLGFSKLFCEKIAFMAMAIFAVHPVNVQTVCWISGRSYLISAGLISIAFLCDKKVEENIIGAVSLAKAGYIGIQSVFAAPFLIKQHRIYKYFLILAFFIGKKAIDSRAIAYCNNWPKDILSGIIVIIRTYAYYFKVAIFPVKLGFYHDIGCGNMTKLQVLDFNFATSLFVLCFIFWSMYKLRSNKVYLYGMSWFLTFLLPVCNVPYAHMIFAERYLYMPMIGFCLAVSGLFNYTFRGKHY